jgi:hypothetical protein
VSVGGVGPIKDRHSIKQRDIQTPSRFIRMNLIRIVSGKFLNPPKMLEESSRPHEGLLVEVLDDLDIDQ